MYRHYANFGVRNENVCYYFRRYSRQCRAEAGWTHCWWDPNNNSKSPPPGMAIVLLLILTIIWSIWTKQTAFVCNDTSSVSKRITKTEKQSSGFVQQRSYHWLTRRQLMILKFYLLIHQLHRSFISHTLIISNCLPTNKWITSISFRRRNKLYSYTFLCWAGETHE